MLEIYCPDAHPLVVRKTDIFAMVNKTKVCGRQFVLDRQQKIIPEPVNVLIRKALLERNSLRGICRLFSVSLTWLLSYLVEIFVELPQDLNFRPHNSHHQGILLCSLKVEMDEIWSFVQHKDNKQWIWIALDIHTPRQVIAFHVGNRDRKAAQQLWQKIPKNYQEHADFYTNLYEPHVGFFKHPSCFLLAP